MSSYITGESDIRVLYRQLIDAWNARGSGNFAELFEMDGNVIGFDGSQINGRAAIEQEMARIFNEHQTATYLTIVKEVRLLTPVTGVLRAVAGMVPPGQSDIDPEVNAVQTLVAVRHSSGWRIALFQNTPAQFHGRPELVKAMTDELRQLIK